jgi:RNA polymerase sigma factor (sigma-70 family)
MGSSEVVSLERIQMGDHSNASPATAQAADFRTTHWSQVLEAGQRTSPNAEAALEQLCRAYWYPIYVYVRRQGHAPHDAEDLTQEFFARLLRLRSLKEIAPHKGKFRTFLLAALHHFLADAWDAAKAEKRGGSHRIVSLDDETAEARYQSEPSGDVAPDVAFERRWLLALLEQALARLRAEHAAAGKIQQFEQMKGFLGNPAEEGEYNQTAKQLGMNSGAVAVAVHRLRQRYRDLVRAEILNTVASPKEMEEELRHLFGR